MKKIILIIAIAFFFVNLNAQTIYTNDMDYVIGDVKQAFIQDKIKTTEQADNLLLGMKNLGVNGIRIPIFATGLTPNKEMFDYFYNIAVAAGFPIFANPAQSSGGQRVACEMLNGEMCTVKNNDAKTNILIQRTAAFASEYKCKWINPFNEDGAPNQAWSTAQINTIYSTLENNLNGAELIGSCTWGIPAGINVMNNTQIKDHITVAAVHNLGYHHEEWDDFIAIAKANNFPVWDSEVNNNIGESNNRGTRVEVAVASGVDGLVMYNIWNTINLTNGSINNGGKILMDIYLKTRPTLTPTYKIDDGTPIESSFAKANSGSTLTLSPLPENGSWSWKGPNNFTATTREVSFNNLSANETGEYVASYTSPDGNVNHFSMYIDLSCTNGPETVETFYKIDEGIWTKSSSFNIDAGSTLDLFASSTLNESIRWMRPNGITTTNSQITITNIGIESSGKYEVTLTDSNNCSTTSSVTVTVNTGVFNDTDTTFPDPDARYYIDNPALNLRVGANGKNAYSTTMDATDYSVQWTITEINETGYYFLDCIGSVAQPRIRTNRTAVPEMTTRGSTGNQPRWLLTESTNNTFILSTALDPTSLPRLQMNSPGNIAMTSETITDDSVRFTFTDTRKGLVKIDASLSVDSQSIVKSELFFPSLLTGSKELKPFNLLDNVKNYQLDVYTIHGQLIYTSTEIENGWNPNGKSSGVYIYRASLTDANNQLITKNGKVIYTIF